MPRSLFQHFTPHLGGIFVLTLSKKSLAFFERVVGICGRSLGSRSRCGRLCRRWLCGFGSGSLRCRGGLRRSLLNSLSSNGLCGSRLRCRSCLCGLFSSRSGLGSLLYRCRGLFGCLRRCGRSGLFRRSRGRSSRCGGLLCNRFRYGRLRRSVLRIFCKFGLGLGLLAQLFIDLGRTFVGGTHGGRELVGQAVVGQSPAVVGLGHLDIDFGSGKVSVGILGLFGKNRTVFTEGLFVFTLSEESSPLFKTRIVSKRRTNQERQRNKRNADIHT